MKEGFHKSRNFQLMLVGAENTGKTSLISSFLGEQFVEGRPATKGVDVEVCKVYCKDWVKISHSDKSNILNSQFSDQCKSNVMKMMADSSIPSLPESSYNPLFKESSITYSGVLFTTAPLTESMMTSPRGGTGGNSSKPYPQHMQEASLQAIQYNSNSLIASLWDFAGQTVFHNSHSVFISDSGISVITFNASV